MEWNMMEPGGSGASGIGSLIEDVYIPSDDCEDVLDEIIEALLKEDPKLRNGRRKLSVDKVIEKDLVPLVKFCADEDIISRAVRLLANLSQPLEVFLQLGYPLGVQCQREIAALVNSSKSCCVDIDFFKSVNSHISSTLGRMDKLVLRLLNHPQKAGVLLEGDGDEEDKGGTTDDDQSDYDGSDLEFIPSQMSKFLSKDFDKQLQLGTANVVDSGANSPGEDSGDGEQVVSSSVYSSPDEQTEKMISERKDKSDSGINSKSSPSQSLERDELMSTSEDSDGMVKVSPPSYDTHQIALVEEREETMLMGEGRRNSELSCKDDMRDVASMAWDSMQRVLTAEKEVMSELLSGSCLMDVDIIVSYLKQFASEIVCSGLSNLVRCLMKALMSTYEGVLDDSFFMWTVGFFLSYARHSQIEFEKYKEILNLDVFGFLVYQGFRNCENLIIQHNKQENCALTKYRLHLVVCTLNQMFQVILTHSKDELAEGSYLHTLQLEVMRKYGSLLEEYTNNNEKLNVAVMTMMYHVAGDCNRGDVLLQLPILKKFSEIWGDITCSKHVEFNDLIEFVLENFMTMAFKDPVKCAQKLFDLSTSDMETGGSAEKTEKIATPEIGGLSEEDQDLLFTWTTDLQGSVSMVDDLVQRLHNRGSFASRQQVMLHLLHNGWLEEKQMEALSEEIRELHKVTDTATRSQIVSEMSALEHDQLLPFLLEKVKAAGFGDQLVWLQEQLLEAAYVRLGVRNSKYRVHVEEPLARFFALQDKSIPLVTVNEDQERVVKDPYFTILLQSLGLFPADTENFFFCRIPHFLSPAELVGKAQQLGDIDVGIIKFNLAEVEEDLSFTEFTPLFKDHSADDDRRGHSAGFSKPAKDHDHQWINFVCRFNKAKQSGD
ncbi:hypothetical protein BaRGS_00040056 [Batillaria attramentaria]|uniref:Timeless C-terminal domain-containing protein n=1 Tax=Batillaria attramentaria TaxID=370345 RepID=A0ABD0J232_9CAEN